MRPSAILFPLVLLVACEASPPAALPTADATASFPKGGLVDTIQINTVDHLPLRAAALIAPDGDETPARDVEANPRPSSSFGQPGAGAAFRTAFSPQSALAGAVVPANQTYSGRPREETELLAMLSTAAIPLPDPVAYRRDWQHYRIRLEFGTPGSTAETREIPAPQPPPAG
jgi:hypothetical protein